MPNFLHPEFTEHPVGALMTTRHGGHSVATCFGGDGETGGGMNLGMNCGDDPLLVDANRRLLAERAGRAVQWLNQVHGSDVIRLVDRPVTVPSVDAAISSSREVALAVQVADCLPVLLAGDGVVGAAHAGWRGLAAGVLENTVGQMIAAGAAVSGIQAWIGPGIGPAAFEVGADVYSAFCEQHRDDAQYFVKRPGTGSAAKWLADLPALARARLRRCGVKQVTGSGHCTVTEQKFFSYRRDRHCGRMAVMIWLDY